MNNKKIRLPNSKIMNCYDVVVNNSTCVIKFVDGDLTEIKGFLGNEIIDYIDILDESGNIIRSRNINMKFIECTFGIESVKTYESRLVKEGYDEEISPAIVDEDGKVIQDAVIVHHLPEYELITIDTSVNMTKAILEKPNVQEELNSIKTYVGIRNPNNMTLEEFKTYYKEMIGNQCSVTIYNGADVETSLGIKHFSYTDKDQSNIQDLFITILAAQENISLPYHADGEYCTMYEGIDIIKIYATLSSNKMYHTTYCNILNRMIENQTDINSIKNIMYGMEITDENDKALLDNIFNQTQSVVQSVLDKFGVENYAL